MRANGSALSFGRVDEGARSSPYRLPLDGPAAATGGTTGAPVRPGRAAHPPAVRSAASP
ncbi:hypothetical protein [Streptomyces minutiscleroticus]|uniref:hypothetical protein n=1 Tax=Streptomyces minutiscleroticus TaxID=68238 RepID=UPI00167D3EB2|nr:hypothetical protein [Streptomyces minutiscleroticus]